MPFAFDDGLLTGYPDIDRQHREIFERFDALMQATKRGAPREEIGEFLVWLTDYTITHFQAEEVVMRDLHYPGFREHKAAHFTFWRICLGLQNDFHDAPAEDVGLVADQIVTTVAGWFHVHILTVDRELALFVRSKADGMLE